MHRNRRKRKLVIFSLIFVLLLMVTGYASFKSSLNIKGSSKVTSNWDVRITNIAKGTFNGSAEEATEDGVKVDPTCSESGTPKTCDTGLKASISVDLYEAGDSAEYDITISNKGNIDAKLDDVIIDNTNSNSAVLITYSGYSKGERLFKNGTPGNSKTIHVKVAYNPEYSGGEVSSEIDLTFEFVQAEAGTIPDTDTYVLTYDYQTNGGTKTNETANYDVGESVDLISHTDSRQGYSFVGWNTDSSATTALPTYQMPNSNATLYAIYEQLDNTPPVIDNISTTKTATSITIVATAHDNETGITKYEFSNDNGSTWIDNGTSGTYTYTSLIHGQTYPIKVRVTNGANGKTISETINVTPSLPVAAFIEYVSKRYKTIVEITYPEGCSDGTYTCTYQKNSDSSVTVNSSNLTNNKISIEFTDSGTVIAHVSDGTNTASSSYIVSMQSTAMTPSIMIGKLEVDVVTSGDGLYEDTVTTDDIAYVYKGANPDNYIYLGSDLYRIMSIDTLGNIKVMRDTPISSMAWDPGYTNSISGITDASSNDGTRYSSVSTDYCYTSSAASSYYGCKSWGSKTSTLNSVGTSSVTQMPWEAGSSTLKNLPAYDSYINVYLNGGIYPTSSGTTTLTSWYSSNIASNLQSKIVNHLWNIGPVASNSSRTLAQDIEEEESYKWRGKIGLMNITDYVRASSNPECTNVYNYTFSGSSLCKNNNSTHNWIYINAIQWTLSPSSSTIGSNLWRVTESIFTGNYNAYLLTGTFRPVLYLASCIKLTGSGTLDDAFQIVDDITCTASSSQTININDKDSQRPTISTTKTTNSITATMNTSNVVGNITKYEFSKDNGNSWQESNNNVYEYTSLTTNNYKVLGRVTKESGEVLITNLSKVILDSIEIPTYEISYPKVSNQVVGDITIAYPSGCGSTFTCTYTKDSGSPVNVTSTTAVVRYTSDGELVASVSDGTNTVVSNSFTVVLPSDSAQIGNKWVGAVTSGDGLYKDDNSNDDTAYLYRGTNPNNYIYLGTDIYRIMSIDTSGNIKVIRNAALSSMIWDPGLSSSITGITASSSTAGTRYSSSSSDYCYTSSAYYYYGCKSWGSKTSTLNSAGTSSITQMPWEAGSSTLKTLPTYDSYLNVYLNGGAYPTTSGTTNLTSWYSTNVASSLQSKIVNHLWNVGPVKSDSSLTLAQNISQEDTYKWRGKIGLMTATDYVRASTNSECNNVYNYNSTSSCYNNSSTHNWLYNGSSQWTMSPYSSSGTSYVWSARSPNLYNYTINNSYGVRPVFYLSSSTSISGSGTSGSPFVAS